MTADPMILIQTARFGFTLNSFIKKGLTFLSIIQYLAHYYNKKRREAMLSSRCRNYYNKF